MIRIKTVNTGSISAGSQKSDEWTETEDIKLIKVIITERSGTTLNASTFYLKIGEDVITLDYAPAKIFQANFNQVPELNISVPAKTTVHFVLKNNESSAINCDIAFIYEK